MPATASAQSVSVSVIRVMRPTPARMHEGAGIAEIIVPDSATPAQNTKLMIGSAQYTGRLLP